MRARYAVLAGAVFAGGMLAAAHAEDGRPFAALHAAITALSTRVTAVEALSSAVPGLSTAVAALTSRVSTLEQQSQAIPGLKIVDADGQAFGPAVFNGSSTYVVLMLDGVAAAFQVADGGFRQAVAPTVWFQSADCSGDPFLTNDTGVIRQGQVLGTLGVYAGGQFRQLQFKSRRAYPAGTCLALTFTTAGAELASVDLSGYRAPFTIAE